MSTLRRIWTVMSVAIVVAVMGFFGLALLQAGAFDPPACHTAPYPDPTPGVRVHDTAEIWSDATEVQATRVAEAVEVRTGAQIVVYSEITRGEISLDEAKACAAAIGNQWGVGRAGFNDGYVILFAIEPNRLHGDVAMVGGDGFREAFIPDDESTRIFDDYMLHFLTSSPPSYDGALLAGLGRVDSLVTAERAAELRTARQVNAVLGLFVAPAAFLLLAGWAFMNWRRYGKDPVYLDSPSIHLPAPPADLTAASGAAVWEGKVTQRAMTTALLDLASRGEIGFVERKRFLGQKVGLLSGGIQPRDDVHRAQLALNDRHSISEAERYALAQLRVIGLGVDADHDSLPGELGETELGAFGAKSSEFKERLEQHIVRQGWLREPPSAATGRWVARGVVEIILGVILFFVALDVPISGLVVVGGAIAAAGIVTLGISPFMPSVTVAGAMIRAMLAAYRRTLEKTMAQARSMQQVVDEAKLDWLDTPDQAAVWGVALGLSGAVEKVLERSAEDLKDGRVDSRTTWLPAWYGSSDGGRFTSGGSGSLFSGSAVPNFGSMMAAVGTIGTPPSSSGSGGGGGGGGGGGFSGGGGGSF